MKLSNNVNLSPCVIQRDSIIESTTTVSFVYHFTICPFKHEFHYMLLGSAFPPIDGQGEKSDYGPNWRPA